MEKRKRHGVITLHKLRKRWRRKKEVLETLAEVGLFELRKAEGTKKVSGQVKGRELCTTHTPRQSKGAILDDDAKKKKGRGVKRGRWIQGIF